MLYFNLNLKYNIYMLMIKNVAEGSIGEELGLKAGDAVLKFNNEEQIDILDCIYYEPCEYFTMTVKKANGNTEEYEIEKFSEEALGLEFDESAEIKPFTCHNKCLFCFVDQLPENMRDTLYIKDDDYRLSFITGSYVTLTNLKESDIKRITEKKFSPLYISVHATDPDIRCKLLNNRFAGNIMALIKRFAESGITMHCQVVLCPGINDGAALKKTAEDLYSFYPAVKSLAVVPVGLTCHRDNLTPIKPVTTAAAAEAIKICENFSGFAQCSDEMYLRANLPLPPYESYGDFEQIENGVGLIRKFEREFNEVSCRCRPVKRDVLVITGESAYNFISGLADKFSKENNIDSIQVKAVKNNYFGESVTVAGLVTGGDIVKQIGGGAEGKEVIIPKCMLKEFDDVFLDGMDILSLEKQLKADVKVCDMYGYSFYDALAGEI